MRVMLIFVDRATLRLWGIRNRMMWVALRWMWRT